MKTTKTIAAILPIALVALMSLSSIPASAYGPSNWQITFSGNCNNKSICDAYYGGTSGFWGWCALGGGVSSGNSADCVQTSYNFLASGATCDPFLGCRGPMTLSVDGNQWVTIPFPPDPSNPSVTLPLAVITSGTVTFGGPFVAQAIAAGLPPPPSCVLSTSGQSATCDLATVTGGFGFGVGFLVPGHSSNSDCTSPPLPVISAPGCHFNSQITEIP